MKTENVISTQEYSGRTIETIKGSKGFWCRWKRPTGHIWQATKHYAFRNAAYSQAINAICDENEAREANRRAMHQYASRVRGFEIQ